MNRTVQTSRAPIDATAALVMLLLTLCWGLNHVAVKVSNTGFNPIFMLVARSLLGGLMVYMWCLYRRIPVFQKDGTLIGGILAGLLFSLEFGLLYVGLDYTTAARGVLMINTMPFFMLLGAHFLLGERMTPGRFLGLALAFAGVVLVFSDQLSMPTPSAVIGDILCLTAGAMWAGNTLAVRLTRLSEASGEKVLLYQVAISAAVMAPAIPLAGPIVRDVSAAAVSAFLFQAMVVVAVTYPVWFALVRRYSASGLSSFAFLSPVFGVLGGGLLLGEPVTPRIVIALVSIAAGLWIVNRCSPKALPT